MVRYAIIVRILTKKILFEFCSAIAFVHLRIILATGQPNIQNRMFSIGIRLFSCDKFKYHNFYLSIVFLLICT